MHPQLDQPFPIVIHHNPACGTSRTVIEIVSAAGHTPTVIEYLQTGWTRSQLQALFAAMGLAPRDTLRDRGSPAEALGLLNETVSDETLLDAMVEHPILVDRPIVVTPKGVKLCRPADLVLTLL